jgi:hypothetical protein
MRLRVVHTIVYLQVAAMLLPGVSAAQESATPPANTLAEAVGRFRGHNRPGYARLDAVYEKSKATRGDAGARLRERHSVSATCLRRRRYFAN